MPEVACKPCQAAKVRKDLRKRGYVVDFTDTDLPTMHKVIHYHKKKKPPKKKKANKKKNTKK